MSDDRIIRKLRHMAWERSKGELRFMLQTFGDDSDNFKKLSKEIDDFIYNVEIRGLQE